MYDIRIQYDAYVVNFAASTMEDARRICENECDRYSTGDGRVYRNGREVGVMVGRICIDPPRSLVSR